MGQFYFLWLIYFILFFPRFGVSDSSDLYETCDWKNDAFTQRIIDEAEDYCIQGNPPWYECLFKEPIYLLNHQLPLLDSCKGENPLAVTTLYLAQNLQQVLTASQIVSQKPGEPIPKVCFYASSVLGAKLWPPEDSSYYYCNSSHSTKTCENMVFHNKQLLDNSCQINDPASEVQEEPNRPPCLDDRYISLITKAFNETADCLGFRSKKDKEQIFSLFLVESFVLLNKIEERPEGKTTNRCFAQLNDNFVENINRHIIFGDREKKGSRVSSYYDYGDIYKEAVNRCPFLKQTFTPHPSTLQGKTLCRYNSEKQECDGNPFLEAHREHKESIRCKTSQDPYSCLFYSMYNARINLLDISDKLDDETRTVVDSHWPDSISQMIPEDSLYNEILIVDGEANINGESVSINNFVQNSSDLDMNLNEQNLQLDPKKISVKAIPLFKNEESLKWAFALWSHNGGNTIIKKQFPDFIQELKKRISNPQYAECETERRLRQEKCSQYKDCKKNIECKKSLPCQENERKKIKCSVCEKCEQCRSQCVECGTHISSLKKCKRYKRYRESLLRGESLEISDLHTEFAQFAVENEIKNYKEVSTFMDKITAQTDSLANSGSLTQAINKLHTGDANKASPHSEEISHLIEAVKKNCPITHPGLAE